MDIKYAELYILSVIGGTRRGIVAVFFRFILLLFSFFYRTIVAFRNWLFDRGWLRSYIPPVPLVISIGNITAGGTGKTPVTLMLAEALAPLTTLAVLSRGYRSQAENLSTPLLLHKQKGLLHPASLCGDEPYLLAHNLPDVMVIVGRDRCQSSKIAARMGARALLLDDGMQHRSIARDLEVIVVDQRDPFGYGHFLPRGLLRESRKSLARADLIIINHADDPQVSEKLKGQISQYSSAPLVRVCVEVIGIFDLKNQPVCLKEGIKAGIFCGIAHPEYFKSTVQQQQVDVICEYSFPDHDAMSIERLIKYSKKCAEKGGEVLLCTEKDRVKLVEAASVSLPINWVKTRLHIIEGHEHWTALMERAFLRLAE